MSPGGLSQLKQTACGLLSQAFFLRLNTDMHYMALHVLLQLCEDKQEVIAQPSPPPYRTAEMPIQRLKGKRRYKFPQAITWTRFRLILQGEQYQSQLCGKLVPMQSTEVRLLSPPAIRAQTSAQQRFVLAVASTGGEI